MGRCFLPAEEHLARRGTVQPAENVEQRRLAAARRTQQHDELAAPDLQVDVAQCVDPQVAAAVHLRQAMDPEDRQVLGAVFH
jgi:hypothetical protein